MYATCSKARIPPGTLGREAADRIDLTAGALLQMEHNTEMVATETKDLVRREWLLLGPGDTYHKEMKACKPLL